MPIIVVSCPHGPLPERPFAPMIDLHCHILPGVDDGSLDLADSLGAGAPGGERRDRAGLRDAAHPPRPRRADRADRRAGRGAQPGAARRGAAGGGPAGRRGGGDRGRGPERGGAGAGRARRRSLDPARAGARPAQRHPDRPRRPPRRAWSPGADRPPRAPPLGRHVRADRGADRRGRPGPGDRRLLPARALRRRHADAGRTGPGPRLEQRRPLLARGSAAAPAARRSASSAEIEAPPLTWRGCGTWPERHRSRR